MNSCTVRFYATEYHAKFKVLKKKQPHRPFPKDSVLMCVFIGCAMYDHNLAVMAHLNLSCYIESGLCYYN